MRRDVHRMGMRIILAAALVFVLTLASVIGALEPDVPALTERADAAR